MSGLAGVLLTGGTGAAEPHGAAGAGDLQGAAGAWLSRMIAAAPWPGRDGVGHWCDDQVGLARFHTAFTPEAQGETQPWHDPRDGRVICFDGRLDHRAQALALLDPPLPRDVPDAQIVLALHRRFGDGFLTRLAGDYALALWAPREQRLLCARSPVGWRPLLWVQDATRFAFATQPATLVRGLGLPKALNEPAMAEFLAARFTSETDTFWQGVQRLPPGHALVVEQGRVRSWRWHQGPFEDHTDESEAWHVEAFLERFDAALQACCRSATPVFAQLSGGLDSSSVVCRATQLFRQGRLDQQVQAVSLRYPGQPHDETEWSQAVEAHCQIQAMTPTPHPYSWDEARAWTARTLHLPLRPNVLLSSGLALKAAGARVLLTGEGGDDWLQLSTDFWPDLLRRGQWRRLWRQVEALPWHRQGRALVGQALMPLLRPPGPQDVLVAAWGRTTAVPDWVQPDWARRTQLLDRWHSRTDAPVFAERAQISRFIRYGFTRRHINWENVLAYADDLGIELRHPFHDLRLTRFFMGAAGEMLRGKRLLREAMRGVLPEVVRTRTTKATFEATIVDAVQARLNERDISQWWPVRLGWLRAEPLAAAHQQWRALRLQGPGAARKAPEGYGRVWFAAAADLWLEQAFQI